MNDEDSKYLQRELLELLEDMELNVAIGLKPGGGITIRSQDERVDASNVGEVRAQ